MTKERNGKKDIIKSTGGSMGASIGGVSGGMSLGVANNPLGILKGSKKDEKKKKVHRNKR